MRYDAAWLTENVLGQVYPSSQLVLSIEFGHLKSPLNDIVFEDKEWDILGPTRAVVQPKNIILLIIYSSAC